MCIDFLTLFVPVGILFTLALAIIATRRVRGDTSFTADQRAVQLWLIWLLPVVGAAFVLSMLHDEPRNDTDRRTHSVLRDKTSGGARQG